MISTAVVSTETHNLREGGISQLAEPMRAALGSRVNDLGEGRGLHSVKRATGPWLPQEVVENRKQV